MRTRFKDVCCRLWTLLQSSAVTVVAVLVAGLGIGADTSIFSGVYSILRHPRHFLCAERGNDLSDGPDHNSRRCLSHKSFELEEP